MVLMPVSMLREGMTIAKDIETNSSFHSYIPLIRRGVCLTPPMITNLERHHIDSVYIELNGTEDVVATDVVSSELKNDALRQIEKAFRTYQKVSDTASNTVLTNINNVSKRLVDSLLADSDVLISLVSLKRHNDYTYTHSLAVALLSIAIGTSMGYRYDELRNLSTAALLHDIGKSCISNKVLNKPGKLTIEEFSLIQTHPQRGKELLLTRNSQISFTTLAGILSHHERFDGGGYPDGLKADEIHPFAKIIAISDVYNALTSERSYHKAEKSCDAVEYIMGNANTQFDIEVVQHFLRKVAAYPVGSFVQLSNGSQAIVVKNYSENILRPLLRLVETDGSRGEELDLMNNPAYYSLTITSSL